MFFIVKFLNIHMNLYMEVVSSLWIFMFKDLSNDILKMKFESFFFFHFQFKNSKHFETPTLKVIHICKCLNFVFHTLFQHMRMCLNFETFL
jgi:hypothetical protein